jgi:hypothetical protein
MLSIHGFVFKKKFEYFKKYEKEFLELYRKIDKEDLKLKFNDKFGKKLSNEIFAYLDKENLHSLFSIQKKLRLKHILKNPVEIIPVFISKIMRLRNYLGFYRQFSRPSLISFIGSDGSGKSALCKMSSDYFEQFKTGDKKNNIIISAGAFSKIKLPKNKEKEISYSEKVMKSNSSFGFKNFLRFLMMIPTQFRIFWNRFRGIAVITDRYAYDLVFFYGANNFTRYLIKTFFQKPTICFYVSVPIKEIKKRNKDLNELAIKKIVNRMDENLKNLSLEKIDNTDFKKSKRFLLDKLSETLKHARS